MQHYLSQLLADLADATQNLPWPYVKQTEVALHDFKSQEEEEATAPVRHLPQWTGITPEMLPPAVMLTDNDVSSVLKSLTALLAACNCHVVFQTEVPERFQYEAIRQNFDQNVKVFQWNDGFFQFCKPNTPVTTCALGQYCQCAFYAELFEGFEEEHLTPEEERARQLDFEVHYLKRKHGSDWMKYYPYHLDKNYDDEHGNPYNYGIDDTDEEKNDDWWRKSYSLNKHKKSSFTSSPAFSCLKEKAGDELVYLICANTLTTLIQCSYGATKTQNILCGGLHPPLII